MWLCHHAWQEGDTADAPSSITTTEANGVGRCYYVWLCYHAWQEGDTVDAPSSITTTKTKSCCA